MRARQPLLTHRRLAVGVALALAAGFAAQAAAAQPLDQDYVGPAYVEELVIAPPVVRRDRDVQRLSQAVSYADLDLTTYHGRDVLAWRIRDTARQVCRALGESPRATSGATRSCQADAVRSVRGQMIFAVRRAYAQAESRAYAYVAPLYD